MSKKPLVSVVMITYGHELYIKKAVEGVLQQKTDFVFEFIIANDHSPDRTDEIIKKTIAEAPSNIIIKYISRDKNIGVIPNLRNAFEEATTDFIAFCEGDDYWTYPHKLQEQFDIISSDKNIGLIYTDVDFYNFETHATTQSIYGKEGKLRTATFEEHLEKKGYLAPPTWFFRKELLNHCDYTDVVDFTFCFALDVFKHSEIHYLDKVTAVRNFVPNSATNQKDLGKQLAYRKGVFDIQKKYMDKYAVSEDLRERSFSSNYIELLPIALKTDDKEFVAEARIFFEKKNVSFDALLNLSKELLSAEKSANNKVNEFYKKLRKYF